MDTPTDGLSTELSFHCPRCHQPVSGRFYGPCPTCVAALAEAYPGLAREVEAPEYAPKMNVVPNQIASKE